MNKSKITIEVIETGEKQTIPFRSWTSNMLQMIQQTVLYKDDTIAIKIDGANAADDDNKFVFLGTIAGTDNTPFVYTHNELSDSGFTRGTVTVSNSGRTITIVQEHTNNTGASVGIQEVGLLVQVDFWVSQLLGILARDVLSAITVASGASIRVTYTLDMSFIELDNVFNQYLSYFQNLSYGASGNITQNGNYTNTKGNSASCSDLNSTITKENTTVALNHPNKAGILLGSDDSATTGTEHKLNTEVNGSDITYGEINFVEINHNTTEYYYEFSRTVTNTGSSTYTIKEMGLYIGDGTNANDDHIMMFDRQVLATPFTFSPGDYITVYYKIGIDIS